MGEFEDRAGMNLPVILGKPDFELGETLAPMILSASALHGTNPVFWGSYLRAVREISIPASHAGPGQIGFEGGPGALVVSLSGVQSYAFYVEADIWLPSVDARMHWDATFAADPVFGTMTRIAAGAPLHYFATPVSQRSEESHFQISLQGGGANDSWSLTELRMLGFRLI